MTSADIESRRGRLLGFVFVILAGFAAVSVVFTFLEPNFLTPLQLTPGAARWGVLVLTIGFIALVWEKERQFRQLSDLLTHQQILLASFENRLRVVENLLETSDRLNTPLALDDVLEVILNAAVDLVGATAGRVEFVEKGGELSLSLAYATPGNTDPESEAPGTVRLPLMDGPVMFGLLHLSPPDGEDEFDVATMEVLERFTVQASNALSKARLLARERAALAYREAANIVKSRFLATLSHDLRTPLTSILGFSLTMTQHWDRLGDEEKHGFIEEVAKQGKNMAQQLERLLEAARVEIEGVVVQPSRHDLRRSVRKALIPYVAQGAGRIKVELPEDEVEAEVDPFVIDQAVSNLVDNALRYTDGDVSIAVTRLDDAVTITVTDSGPGIHGDKLKRVIDPMTWQEEDMRKGSGLGLHIVGTLIDSHGGEIRVSSSHLGTSIAIMLPTTFEKAKLRATQQLARPALD